MGAVQTGISTGRGWLNEHAVAVVGIAVAIGGVIALALFSTSKREFGTVLTCSAAAFAVGSLLGFLIGGPGADGGEEGTKTANSSGWSSRLGVFGTWLTGAAFALALSNWSELSNWFATVTRTAATPTAGDVRLSTQYAFGAAMITAASGGFIFGFMQMATAGRRLFANVEAEVRRVEREAEAAVKRAQEATARLEQARQSADEAATEATALLEQARQGADGAAAEATARIE